MSTGLKHVDWVPVEDRWLGMDRRALVPAVVVALFAAFVFWGLPALDAAVSREDPVKAGDVIQLGREVTFAPATGWEILAGLRQGEDRPTGYPTTAQVTKGGVLMSVISDSFDGTPAELLDQIKKTNERLDPGSALTLTGRARTFTTVTGQRGVVAPFSAGSGVGLLAAFVFDGTGVEVVAYGPTQIGADAQRDIVSMLESIQPVTASTGASS